MAVDFRYQGFKFFFYSNGGSPREPVHIHVTSADGEAKIWLSPPGIGESDRFDAKTLRRLLNAPPQQCLGYSISRSGIHWEKLDEDISIAGLIAGRGDQSNKAVLVS